MSGLVLFTDNVLYICKFKDIFMKGKVFSVKYSDKRKYAAHVLAICNDEHVLNELKSNLEGERDEVGENWTCVDRTERSYAKVSKEISKKNDDSILFVKDNILSEKWGKCCMNQSSETLLQELMDLSEETPVFLQWRIQKLNPNEIDKVSAEKPKISRKRKKSPEHPRDNTNGKELKRKMKYAKVSETPVVFLEPEPSHGKKKSSRVKDSVKNSPDDLMEHDGLNSHFSVAQKPPTTKLSTEEGNFDASSLDNPCDDFMDKPGLESQVFHAGEPLLTTSALDCHHGERLVNHGVEPGIPEVKDVHLNVAHLKKTCDESINNLECKSQIMEVEEAILPTVQRRNPKCRKRLDFDGRVSGQSAHISVIEEIHSKVEMSQCDQILEIVEGQDRQLDSKPPFPTQMVHEVELEAEVPKADSKLEIVGTRAEHLNEKLEIMGTQAEDIEVKPSTTTSQVHLSEEALLPSVLVTTSCDDLIKLTHPKCRKRLDFYKPVFDGSTSQTGAGSLIEQIESKIEMFNDNLQIRGAKVERVEESPLAATSLVNENQLQGEKPKSDGKLKVVEIRVEKLDKSLPTPISCPEVIREVPKVDENPETAKAKFEQSEKSAPTATPPVGPPDDSINNHNSPGPRANKEPLLAVSPNSPVIHTENHKHGSTVRHDEVLPRAALLQNSLHDPGVDLKTLDVKTGTALAENQHQDLSLNQSIAYELSNSPIQTKNSDGVSIVPETDCEDESSLHDNFPNLRNSLRRENISSVSAQPGHSVSVEILQIREEENSGKECCSFDGSTSQTGASSLIEQIKSKTEMFNDDLQIRGAQVERVKESPLAATSLVNENQLQGEKPKSDGKLEVIGIRVEKLDKSLPTPISCLEAIQEVPKVDENPETVKAQFEQSQKSAPTATPSAGPPDDSINNHNSPGPRADKKPLLAASLNSSVIHTENHELGSTVRHDEVLARAAHLQNTLHDPGADLKTLDGKTGTALAGNQHQDLSLNQSIAYELSNSPIQTKNSDGVSIVPETDCEDESSLHDNFPNLRNPLRRENISSVSAQPGHSVSEGILQIREEENSEEKKMIEIFLEHNVTVTESLLDNLMNNYDSQSPPSQLNKSDDRKSIINHEMGNSDIDPFQNNVVIDQGLAGVYKTATTSGSSLKKFKKKKQVPKVISDEMVGEKIKILRKCTKKPTADHSRNSKNILEDMNDDENFGVPELHSTACEADDISTETRPHFKDSESKEFSEDGESSDDYDPKEDQSVESDSDEDQADEDIDEDEYKFPEPLNITSGDKAPTSAPDDRELNVEVSSAGLKKHFCLYCQKFQSKIARHLELVHKDQEDVKRFMVLPPKTRERQEIIAVIRKNGDFLFNSDRRFNNGSLIVCRRPNARMMKNAEDFMVCGQCKGQYAKSVLRHHFRECAKHDGKNQRVVMVKGKKIAARVHARASKDVRTKIFPYLREDGVVKAIRYDELVTLYANKMCEKHGTHQHLFQMIRAKLRLLGRFLLSIKSIEHRIETFSDVFQPRFYDAAIEAIRDVAKFDPEKRIFEAPAVASGYGTLLKRIGEILRSECIKQERVDDQRRVEDFLKLLAEDYGTSINRVVTETQTQNNRRKEVILPNTDDIKQLHNYVKTERNKYYSLLSNKFTYSNWENLAKMTLLSLQIFNRRRPGEIERLYVEDFRSHRGLDHATDSEAYEALSEEGKKLARKYVRFEIRGKLGRGVPVLIDTDVLDCLNLLIHHRKHAGVPDKNSYLFGLPSTDSDRNRHLHACDLMRESSIKCGAENPEALRGTNLRKHIATRCINLNLTQGQVADLANFMGHAEKIHKEIYRQPVLETDIVKISKLLNAAQGLNSSDDESDEANKNECTIPVRKYTRRANDTGDSTDPADISSLTSSKNISTAKQQWTTDEKTTVFSAFGKQLKTGKVPSGKELQHLIDSNQCLKGRTVPQLRTWLHTQKKKLFKP